MARLDFVPSREQQEIAVKKTHEIIDLLEDIKDIRMKAWILFELIGGFKDISGIDVCQSFKIEKKIEGKD